MRTYTQRVRYYCQAAFLCDQNTLQGRCHLNTEDTRTVTLKRASHTIASLFRVYDTYDKEKMRWTEKGKRVEDIDIACARRRRWGYL
jgi:hypothetical protein